MNYDYTPKDYLVVGGAVRRLFSEVSFENAQSIRRVANWQSIRQRWAPAVIYMVFINQDI